MRQLRGYRWNKKRLHDRNDGRFGQRFIKRHRRRRGKIDVRRYVRKRGDVDAAMRGVAIACIDGFESRRYRRRWTGEIGNASGRNSCPLDVAGITYLGRRPGCAAHPANFGRMARFYRVNAQGRFKNDGVALQRARLSLVRTNAGIFSALRDCEEKLQIGARSGERPAPGSIAIAP